MCLEGFNSKRKALIFSEEPGLFCIRQLRAVSPGPHGHGPLLLISFLSLLPLRHLAQNPFMCDCHLKWLADYLFDNPIETSGARCSHPRRLANKRISQVKSKKFRCTGRWCVHTYKTCKHTGLGKHIFWYMCITIYNWNTFSKSRKRSYCLSVIVPQALGLTNYNRDWFTILTHSN